MLISVRAFALLDLVAQQGRLSVALTPRPAAGRFTNLSKGVARCLLRAFCVLSVLLIDGFADVRLYAVE